MITQGKWETTKPNEHGECEIVIPDGRGDVEFYIAKIFGGLGWVPDDSRYYESEANARLIASAPALLAACKSIVDREARNPGYIPGLGIAADMLREVIAQAEGG